MHKWYFRLSLETGFREGNTPKDYLQWQTELQTKLLDPNSEICLTNIHQKSPLECITSLGTIQSPFSKGYSKMTEFPKFVPKWSWHQKIWLECKGPHQAWKINSLRARSTGQEIYLSYHTVRKCYLPWRVSINLVKNPVDRKTRAVGRPLSPSCSLLHCMMPSWSFGLDPAWLRTGCSSQRLHLSRNSSEEREKS